jgi:hypothetical protein
MCLRNRFQEQNGWEEEKGKNEEGRKKKGEREEEKGGRQGEKESKYIAGSDFIQIST